MKLLWAYLILMVLTAQVSGQTDSTYYTAEMFQPQLEELRARHGLKKSIPYEYELGILAALAHYPQLDSIPIDFVLLPITSTMMAQPRTRTFFKGIANRHYVIFINSSKENTGFLPSELSFNQFLGVMGHELAHIRYYTQQSAFQLLIDGFGYYDRKYRRDFERGTDLITIEHDLGWQLLDFKNHVRNKAQLSRRYARLKKNAYLTEKELFDILTDNEKP